MARIGPEEAVAFYAAAIGYEFMHHEELHEKLVNVDGADGWDQRVQLATRMAYALHRAVEESGNKWITREKGKWKGEYDILETVELFTKIVLETVVATSRIPSPEELEAMASASFVKSELI
jgi:hypothetical protein